MSEACDIDCGLAVLSRGEARGMDRTLLDPRAVTTVRYADEAAWTVATAVARALAPVRAQLPLVLDDTGLIVASPANPRARRHHRYRGGGGARRTRLPVALPGGESGFHGGRIVHPVRLARPGTEPAPPTRSGCAGGLVSGRLLAES